MMVYMLVGPFTKKSFGNLFVLDRASVSACSLTTRETLNGLPRERIFQSTYFEYLSKYPSFGSNALS